MREWIDLLEAKKLAKPVVDNKQRSQVVYDKSLKVAAELARTNFDFRSGWDQSWVNMIRIGITNAKKAHEDDQKQEEERAKEEDETFTPSPFELEWTFPDVTAKWWDDVAKHAAYQMEADARWAYEDYLEGHPRVEMSDEMSVLDDHLRMAKNIYYKGSDTIEGMTIILDEIASFINDGQRYVHDDLWTRSTIDFICKCIPAILLICKYMGATKSTKA